MRFANREMLWVLAVLLPLLIFFLVWAWRRKQKLIGQFVQSRLLANLTVGVSRTLQKSRLVLLTLAVGLLILALARPQWGEQWEEAKQRGLDIVVAIDTSRSMLAADLPPNRLARAKLAALDLLRIARNDRLGLVAFSGTAFLQCPLTLDEEAFRQSVAALDVGIIPQGGTALTEAIKAAQTAFKKDEDNHKVLVLFTDGEDHEAGALEAAKQAAEAGVRIFTIGVGTANGELLRVTDAQTGNSDYIRDSQGNVVKSRLDESLLTQMATAGNGFYLPMSGGRTIETLYERGLAPLPKSEISAKLVRQYKERYHWPLALAVLILILEIFLPDQKRPRRLESSGESALLTPRTEKTAAAVAALLLMAMPTVSASTTSALKNYDEGKYREAQEEYQRLLERRPNDSRLQYNAGTAAYKAGEFDRAADYFRQSSIAPDLALQQSAYYNLGNSLYRLGENEAEPPKKIKTWEDAAKQYEAALKLNQEDKDARYNLDLVRHRIEELKKQQEQQKQQDQKNQDKNKDEQNKDQQQEQNQDQKQQDQQKQDDQQQSQDKQDQQQQQQKDQQSGRQDEKEKEEPNQDQNGQDDKKEQEQKKPEQDQQANNSEDSKPGEPSDPGEAAAAALGKMTEEQAKQLLDSQRSDEKAMIFIPPKDKQNQKQRIFKDW